MEFAFDKFMLSSKNTVIPEEDIEPHLLLGINLSLVAENAEVYVSFKKELINFLIKNSRNEDAKREVAELHELLPNDVDLLSWRVKLLM